jgi:hypothetical protein
MMNLTSMNLRNLYPKQSMPGVLHGWKLVFRTAGGMGDIDESPEDSFHGILHQLTVSEFKHLDTIEGYYRRTPVKVSTYDGKVIDAFAYKMDMSRIDRSIPDGLPGERYLDIIIRGARHFGVKEEYIQKLAQIPTQPRKKVSEYRKVQTPQDRIISVAELAAAKGSDPYDPAIPLMVSINGKVLQWVVPPGDNPAVKASYDWSRTRYGGQEICVGVCKTLYEPLYPIPTTYEAMPPDMRAWGEDLFVGFNLRGTAKQEGMRLANWEVIGWLEGFGPQAAAAAGAAQSSSMATSAAPAASSVTELKSAAVAVAQQKGEQEEHLWSVLS